MMESPVTAPSSFEVADTAGGAGKDDLKALKGLRARIEGVVNEVERLRAENAALAERMAGLDDAGQASLPSLPAVPAGEDMRERLDAFITAIDQALREADTPARS